MNQEESQKKKSEDYEKAFETIMTESAPGESNLVALLSINLKLLIDKVYSMGWDDGFKACTDQGSFEEAQNDGRS